jgi:hypothetical protein
MNRSSDGWYRVTCKRFTCGMVVTSEMVADSAPILRKYLGLPITEAIVRIRKEDPDTKIVRRGDLEEL